MSSGRRSLEPKPLGERTPSIEAKDKTGGDRKGAGDGKEQNELDRKYRKAMEAAQRAVTDDNARNPRGALENYNRAIELLVDVSSNLDKNSEEFKTAIRRLNRYRIRLQELKAEVYGQPSARVSLVPQAKFKGIFLRIFLAFRPVDS